MIAITTLVNNTAPDNLQCEHGLSFWIEYNGKNILFDTGQTNILENNAKQIGVDLASTDTVILSHGHYDHTGGIPSVYAAAPKFTLYLHPRAMDMKYSRKANKLKNIGMSDATRKVVNLIESRGKLIWTESPKEVFPGFFITGTIPRKTSFENTGGDFHLDENCTCRDEVLDDQAIYFKTEKGLVVLLGCAHAGVVNTLDYVSRLTGEECIYAVLGGMHLMNASQNRMVLTIEAMKKYNIQKNGLAHCTGNTAMKTLKNAFNGKCFECLAGNQIKF